MKRVSILVLAIMCASVVCGRDRKVAVFDPTGSVDYTTKEIIREEISSVVVSTSGYTLLARQLINEVLKEYEFQIEESRISEIGMRMGANLVLVSNLVIMGDENYYISCKLINVFTDRVEKQQTGQTNRGSEDLIALVRKMVNEMLITEVKSVETTKPSASSNQKEEEKRKKEEQEKEQLAMLLSTPPILVCGVEVMVADLPGKYKWSQALRVCPEGWRLPTANELQCICEQKKRVGLEFKGKQYWSSTETKKKDQAISRTINDCKPEVEDMDKECCVRCVR
jgi:hypothetical protein